MPKEIDAPSALAAPSQCSDFAGLAAEGFLLMRQTFFVIENAQCFLNHCKKYGLAKGEVELGRMRSPGRLSTCDNLSRSPPEQLLTKVERPVPSDRLCAQEYRKHDARGGERCRGQALLDIRAARASAHPDDARLLRPADLASRCRTDIRPSLCFRGNRAHPARSHLGRSLKLSGAPEARTTASRQCRRS